MNFFPFIKLNFDKIFIRYRISSFLHGNVYFSLFRGETIWCPPDRLHVSVRSADVFCNLYLFSVIKLDLDEIFIPYRVSLFLYRNVYFLQLVLPFLCFFDKKYVYLS